MSSQALARLGALIIATAAFAGIGIHLQAQLTAAASLAAALWVLGGYFTVLTNLLVAVVFTIIALAGPARVGSRLLGGVMLAIVLVGIVYGLLLQGLAELTAGAAVANVLLHRVTPVLVPLYWLACVPKGHLRWRDPVLWALYPLAYLAYALARGFAEGHFAYPFIDVPANGAGQVSVTVLVITAAFLVAGWAVVWLDHWFGRFARRP